MVLIVKGRDAQCSIHRSRWTAVSFRVCLIYIRHCAIHPTSSNAVNKIVAYKKGIYDPCSDVQFVGSSCVGCL
jgi:hypothetical protein